MLLSVDEVSDRFHGGGHAKHGHDNHSHGGHGHNVLGAPHLHDSHGHPEQNQAQHQHRSPAEHASLLASVAHLGGFSIEGLEETFNSTGLLSEVKAKRAF